MTARSYDTMINPPIENLLDRVDSKFQEARPVIRRFQRHTQQLGEPRAQPRDHVGRTHVFAGAAPAARSSNRFTFPVAVLGNDISKSLPVSRCPVFDAHADLL